MARLGTLIAYIRAHSTLDQPLVPAGWHVVQEDTGWASIYPLGRERSDVVIGARLMIRRSGFTPHRGLFVIIGSAAARQYIVNRVAADALPWTLTWADLPAFRADAAVQTLRGEWPPAEVIAGLARLGVRLWHDDDGEGGPT
jgi:hypothetical protein